MQNKNGFHKILTSIFTQFQTGDGNTGKITNKSTSRPQQENSRGWGKLGGGEASVRLGGIC